MPRSNFGVKNFFLQNFIFFHPFKSINFQPVGFLAFQEKSGPLLQPYLDIFNTDKKSFININIESSPPEIWIRFLEINGSPSLIISKLSMDIFVGKKYVVIDTVYNIY